MLSAFPMGLKLKPPAATWGPTCWPQTPDPARWLQTLSALGVDFGFVKRAGPSAAAIWGGPVTGLTEIKLHGLRVSSLKATERLSKGASLGLRI